MGGNKVMLQADFLYSLGRWKRSRFRGTASDQAEAASAKQKTAQRSLKTMTHYHQQDTYRKKAALTPFQMRRRFPAPYSRALLAGIGGHAE